MSATKKIHERNIITKFISNKSLQLIVKSLEDSETPDFIIETLEECVSIELTTLINPMLRAKEALCDAIVEEAKRMFEAKYKEKLYVLVTFYNYGVRCSKADISLFAKELFTIVENIYLNNRNFNFSITSKDKYPPIAYIEKIFVENKASFSHWQTFGCYCVETLDNSVLINSIHSKEMNLRKYSNQFDQNWLVLGYNFGDESSSADVKIEKEILKNSKFDKIFLYRAFEDKISILK